MSINQLVKQVKKSWLDAKVGGVTIDGSLSYDDTNKATGDSLVLDASKIARWIPIAALNFGSVFVGRFTNQTLTSSVIVLPIVSINPFPAAAYSLIDGNLHINATGNYLCMVQLFSTDTIASMAIEVKVNSTAVANSQNVSPESPILSFNKRNVGTFQPLKLNAGDVVSVIANALSATANIFTVGNVFAMMRLS